MHDLLCPRWVAANNRIDDGTVLVVVARPLRDVEDRPATDGPIKWCHGFEKSDDKGVLAPLVNKPMELERCLDGQLILMRVVRDDRPLRLDELPLEGLLFGWGHLHRGQPRGEALEVSPEPEDLGLSRQDQGTDDRASLGLADNGPFLLDAPEGFRDRRRADPISSSTSRSLIRLPGLRVPLRIASRLSS